MACDTVSDIHHAILKLWSAACQYKHVIDARWKGHAGFDQGNKSYDILPPEYDTPVTVTAKHTKELNKACRFQHKASVTMLKSC